MADNIEPISHLEKVITGDVEPISHLEQVIALYGGTGGSGGSGTTNYNALLNKPSINGVDLVGNKTLADLGITNYDDTQIKEDINEVDGKIEALKSSQSLEYEGESATCNNTLASRTSDMFIKGKTYLNLGTGGLESAGEKENKISISSNNKNLVDPNKLFLNNSSIIKENGAFICPPNVSWQSEKIMGVDLSKPLYFAYEIKSDENIIIDKTNQNMLIRLDYVKTGKSIEATKIPIGAKITNEYTKFIFKNISLSNTDKEQGINLVFRNGVGKKMYVRNITISNAPIDDVIPYQQDKKEILLPIEGGLKYLSNGVADTIEQRTDGVYLVQRVKKETYVEGDENNNNYLTDKVNTYKPLEKPVKTKLDIQNLDLEVYKDTTYITTDNAIQPTLSFKVPYNIGGIIQENAQNINKLYKLIDEVIIPQLVNNSADIEILKLK